jgi:GNAT superfamily N-acetyltransferase
MTDEELAMAEHCEARAYERLLLHAPETLRQELGLAVHHVGGAVALVAGGIRQTLMLNRVIGLGLREPLTPALLERIDRIYHDAGVDTYAVELTPPAMASPAIASLPPRAARMCYVSTTMMVRPADPGVDPGAGDFAVRQVGASQASAFADLCRANFNLGEPVGRLLAAGFTDPCARHYLGYEGQQPVAAGLTMAFDDGVAWLGWVNVLPGHRGRGLQRALASLQTRGALAQGARWITLEAAFGSARGTTPSYRNYERLGWRPTCDRTTCIRRSNTPQAASAAT